MKYGSERSRPGLKARLPRLMLRLKRQRQREPRWYTTADGEGNVQVHGREVA